MTELDCESVCMAAMAVADGSQSALSSDQIEAHLAGCPDCRREVGQLLALSSLLDEQKRRLRTVDIWTKIEGRLPDVPPGPKTSPRWHPFMLLGLLLLGFRLVEMIPDRDFGFWPRLLPVLLIVAVFSYVKENPFKINTELRLEGE